MSDIKAIIDWFLNGAYNIWLTLSQGLGIWFAVVIAARFGIPWFFKIVKRLMGASK